MTRVQLSGWMTGGRGGESAKRDVERAYEGKSIMALPHVLRSWIHICMV